MATQLWRSIDMRASKDWNSSMTFWIGLCQSEDRFCSWNLLRVAASDERSRASRPFASRHWLQFKRRQQFLIFANRCETGGPFHPPQSGLVGVRIFHE